MPEAGCVLALWNDVDPALDAEYNRWHAHEHVPERLSVPGMLWGRRYRRTDGGCGAGAGAGAAVADAADDGAGAGAATDAHADMPRYLTLYGLRDAAVLDSEPYLKLLREPTPMSRRMRPELLRLARWVCDLQAQGDAEAGSHLAVSTFDDSGAAQAAADEARRVFGPQWRGQLVARRLSQASALPWLQASQSGGVTGAVLLCTSFDAAAARPVVSSGSTRFERLR